MDPSIIFALTAMLFVGGFGAIAYAFLGGSDATQKRIASLAQRKALGSSGKTAADANQLRRKNVQPDLGRRLPMWPSRPRSSPVYSLLFRIPRHLGELGHILQCQLCWRHHAPLRA